MAGHASGWIKRPGTAKGRVFVSRAALKPSGTTMEGFKYELRTSTPEQATRLLNRYVALSVQPGGQAKAKPRMVRQGPSWSELRDRDTMNRVNQAMPTVTIPPEGTAPYDRTSPKQYEQLLLEATSNAEDLFDDLPQRIKDARPDLARRVQEAGDTYEAYDNGEARPYEPTSGRLTPEPKVRRALELINGLIEELDTIRLSPDAEIRRLATEDRRASVNRGQGQLPGLEEFAPPTPARPPRQPRAATRQPATPETLSGRKKALIADGLDDSSASIVASGVGAGWYTLPEAQRLIGMMRSAQNGRADALNLAGPLTLLRKAKQDGKLDEFWRQAEASPSYQAGTASARPTRSRATSTPSAPTGLPQDLTTMTQRQAREVVAFYVSSMTPAQIRDRMRLNRDQIGSAREQMNRAQPGSPEMARLARGLENLMTDQGLLMSAEDKQTAAARPRRTRATR